MFLWDCTWGSRTAAVTARTAIGAKKAACKAWGRTVRRPEDSEIQVFIRRHEDGTPVRPESGADAVVARIMSQKTPPRQQEDW